MINTMQELAQEAFIAKLSDIAEYKTPNEIWWEDQQGDKITIEFIGNSVSNFVIRDYSDIGNKIFEEEYQNGLQHGKTIWWYEKGNKYYEVKYKNGLRHGKAIWWDEDGNIECKAEYQNGKLINEQHY